MIEIFSNPLIPQLAIFAVASSVSPGPNNLLIASTSAIFGIRETLPTLLGMYAGFALMFVLTGLGAVFVFTTHPWLLLVLQIGGTLYLVQLAASLLKATWKASSGAKPPGFLRGLMMQFVNPKLWMMVIATVALCSPSGTEVQAPVGLIIFFISMTVPGLLLYLGLGSILNNLSPRTKRRTNVILAVATAGSALMLLAPIATAV